MQLHFSRHELAARRARVGRDLAGRGLAGMLAFRQETMYYLTGYDTFGYVFFQCLYLGTDGRMALLTRAPDRRQAAETSVVEDVRIWVDGPDADPAADLREMLRELGATGARLGVEYDAYGLTARNGHRLERALAGFADLADASDLVSRHRAVKSETEIAYVRRAAGLADAAYDEALRLAAPGADEGAILAAMQGSILAGGGDYPGNEFVIGSGPGARLCRYRSGRRRLDPADQLTLEWAGAYRHYHAAMMRTVRIGPPPAAQVAMHEAAREALLAVEAAFIPGASFGDAFDAHASTLDRVGYRDHRMNACGYSLGATFSPNWMDWPMLYHGNPARIEAGMVIFCHIIVFDDDTGLAMTLGRTSLVTGAGPEPLSERPLDLPVI